MRVVLVGASIVLLACGVALGEPPLHEIATSVRQGDASGALAQIAALPARQREGDAVRYLEGRLSLDAGRPCDAARMLARTPSTLPPALVEDSARRWALAAARCGDCDKARSALLTSSPGDPSTRRHDRSIAAQCAVRLGDLEAGAAELEALTDRGRSGVDRVALLKLLSDVYGRLGRPALAQAAARDAWVLAADEEYDATLTELEALSAPTPADRITRAEGLIAARRFERAVEELEQVRLGDDETGLNEKWQHVYGMALFRMRTRYADAARVLKKSASLGGKYAAEDAFHAARALSRADQDRAAVRAYRRFAAKYPRSSRATQARYLAAWLEIRMGRKNGEKQMERLVRGPTRVRGKWKRQALWQLGFRAFETKRYTRATRYLEQYAAVAKTSMDKAQALYWLGRARRRGPKAIDAYRRAIRVDPLHWYALLAADRLRRLGVKPPTPFEAQTRPPKDIDGGAGTLPNTYTTFNSLGLHADGVQWLRAHESRLVEDVSKQERRAALVRLYLRAEAYREAIRVARQRASYVRREPSDLPWWWEAAYPMPWREAVDDHRGDLPPGLIYATMRQESGFQPEVISRAGAVGLMQVMPSAGTRIAGKPVTRRSLLVPERNIELGVDEMQSLAEAFNDVYPLSIAAYNAGQKRVRRWLKESQKMELDRFVERIPFDETRNYVRRVTTHYARYRYLDDPKSGWLKLPRTVRP